MPCCLEYLRICIVDYTRTNQSLSQLVGYQRSATASPPQGKRISYKTPTRNALVGRFRSSRPFDRERKRGNMPKELEGLRRKEKI